MSQRNKRFFLAALLLASCMMASSVTPSLYWVGEVTAAMAVMLTVVWIVGPGSDDDDDNYDGDPPGRDDVDLGYRWFYEDRLVGPPAEARGLVVEHMHLHFSGWSVLLIQVDRGCGYPARWGTLSGKAHPGETNVELVHRLWYMVDWHHSEQSARDGFVSGRLMTA